MINITLADKFIVLISLVMLATLFSLTWANLPNTRYASVFVNGEKRYLIDLLEDKVLELEGIKGHSQIEISEGKVRFIASPCHTGYCIRSGWLNPVIGVIACLPNGVSLQFINHNKTYDGINF